MTLIARGSRVRVNDAGAAMLGNPIKVGMLGTVDNLDLAGGYISVELDDNPRSEPWGIGNPWLFFPEEFDVIASPEEMELPSPMPPPFVQGKWGEEPDATEDEKYEARQTMRILDAAILFSVIFIAVLIGALLLTLVF